MAIEKEDAQKKRFDDEVSEAKAKADYYEQVMTALNTEPRYQEFFRNYPEEEVAVFKKDYAQKRVRWHFNKSDSLALKAKFSNRFREYCQNAFEQIQARKLFNIMSLWMSKQLDVTGTEVSYDWYAWTRNVFNCPHVSPITKEEVDVFLLFLAEADDNYSIRSSFFPVELLYFLEDEDKKGSQRWDKDEYDCDYHYNAWFRFYDQHYYAHHFKDLPGTRINLEFKYLRHYNKVMDSKKTTVGTQPSPNMVFYHKEKETLFNQFENIDFKHFYWAKKKVDEEFDFASSINIDVIHLTEENIIIPIEHHDDWREGVKIACEKYHRSMVKRIIWDVYDEYLDKMATKDNFEDWGMKPSDYSETDRADRIERIIKGRAFMGEPANLDFLKQ